MRTDRGLRAGDPCASPAAPHAGRPPSGRSRDAQGGFTLIELLVVVVIIGILAAISVPTFFGARAEAKDVVLQADLAHAKQATLAWAGANAGTGLPAIDTQLREWGYTASGYSGDGARPGYTASGYTGAGSAPEYKDGSTAALFCIIGTSETGQQYSVTSHGSVRRGFCPFSTSEW